MKILCLYTACGPHYVRSGWGHVFTALGHDFRFWNMATTPAFDVFSEFEPDLLIGTTYDLDRATYKNIVKRPNMRVILYASAWGPYLKDVDLKKYPLVVAGEQEKRTIDQLRKETGKPDFVFIHAHDRWLDGTMSGWSEIGVPYYGVLNAADTFVYLNGEPKPEFACDVAFVGGYWGYKGRNLDKFLLPLCHPSKGLNIKIFGNQTWPVHQYLGFLEDQDVKHLFASATVCPNVSEPHSTELGFDVVERPYKIMSSGGFCVSDYIEEARDLFDDEELVMCSSPQQMEATINHFLNHPNERNTIIERGQSKVLAKHTYFNRVADILLHLGMDAEAEHCLALRPTLRETHDVAR